MTRTTPMMIALCLPAMLFAAIEPLAPVDGVTVPLVPDAQKKVMDLPTRQERIELLQWDRKNGKKIRHDPYWRKARPLVLELKTTAGENGPWKVQIGKRADLSDARTWYVKESKTDKATGEVIDNSNLAQLVQYDRKWRRMHAWILPSRLLEEIRPASLSGAVLIGDTFYCTGHDAPKCHLLRIPDTGFTLEWIGDIDVPFYGQGIARGRDGDLWGIIRSESAVVRSTR